MSDYGDDYSDYGAEDWFYVEEEYMPADDLAEHAVQSPPPTVYDEDRLEEWDRFDYFNDIEYASDGYDNVTLETKTCPGDTKIGRKRKRPPTTSTRGRKRHQPAEAHTIGQGDADMLINAPVVWRSQESREANPRVWSEDTGSYALLKDWRERLADAPQWPRQSSHPVSPAPTASPKFSRSKSAQTPELPPAAAVESEGDDEEEEIEEEEGDDGSAGLDPAAILAVLQQRLAAEGGPLSGMNPEQVLQFAMRMANGEDGGDDIAGEMADEMLEKMMGDGDVDEEDEEAEANLMSWVEQQRNVSNKTTAEGSAGNTSANKDIQNASQVQNETGDETTQDSTTKDDNAREEDVNTDKLPNPANPTSRKRKATPDAEGAPSGATPNKRRATRSYQSSTAASQAKAAPPAPRTTTKSTRSKR